MMNYNDFKSYVVENIVDFLPESFADSKVEVQSINKVNCVRDGLIIRKPGTNISPTIYLDSLYESFVKCDNLELTMSKIARYFLKQLYEKPDIDVNTLRDPDYIKQNVVFKLINTEQNKEFLTNLPHREFLDLSIVYSVIVSNAISEDDGLASTLITNFYLESLGFSEEELYDMAYENTLKLFPPTTTTILETIGRMLGLDNDGISEMLASIPYEKQMFVISNCSKINGSISMLFDDCLFELAEKLNSDLYIMPSSLHEVIAVASKYFYDADYLASMVTEVNCSDVSPDERLSNQVYHYDRQLHKLTLATEMSDIALA